MHTRLLSVLLLAACAAPGVELQPLASDFALLEVDLRG